MFHSRQVCNIKTWIFLVTYQSPVLFALKKGQFGGLGAEFGKKYRVNTSVVISLSFLWPSELNIQVWHFATFQPWTPWWSLCSLDGVGTSHFIFGCSSLNCYLMTQMVMVCGTSSSSCFDVIGCFLRVNCRFLSWTFT